MDNNRIQNGVVYIKSSDISEDETSKPIHHSDGIPYDDIDVECHNLVKALNKLPGIETTECCCGHGKSPYLVFIKQKDLGSTVGLNFLAKLMSRRYYGYINRGWKLCITDINDSRDDGVEFELWGPMGSPAYENAEEMAYIINNAIEENEWPVSLFKPEQSE